MPSLPPSTHLLEPAPVPASTSALPIQPPAFVLETDYFKFAFKDNRSVETKIRWLTEINRTFHFDRNLAKVKMSAAVTIRPHLQTTRKYSILSLSLEVIQDSPETPRKFPSYLLIRFPVGVDPLFAKELSVVHSAHRFHQNGVPINRLFITWSLPEPHVSTIAFDFLLCLLPCELCRLKNDQPWCFRCFWFGFGYIFRY